MKKFIKIFIIMFFYILALVGIFLAGYIYGNKSIYNIEAQKIETDDDILILNVDFEIQKEIDLLPNYIKQQYSKEGFISIVEDTNYEGISGLYHTLDNRIVIDYEYIEYATLHEFGHYVDTQCGYLSEQDDFVEIYNTEKVLVSEYCQTDSGEFFAEAFKMYLHDELGENLLVYNYMEQLISDIEQNGF